jgi:hypothetical protein
LLVIPTENKSKERSLLSAFETQKPKDVVLHSIKVPLNSGVGEQPYNEAGVTGAHDRISNASHLLKTQQYRKCEYQRGSERSLLRLLRAIYSLITSTALPTSDWWSSITLLMGERQQDCHRVLLFLLLMLSEHAEFGFERNSNYGRVRVSQMLAVHVPGLDKADWQGVLGGHSRYELLSEAISHLSIPW